MNCTRGDQSVNPSEVAPYGLAHLVVVWGKLVETLLDHVVAIQILDEHNDVQAQREDDRVDLSYPTQVSLPSTTVSGMRVVDESRPTCRRVDKKSIIFWTARVPCMFKEMLTRSCATDSQITLRCSSVENSKSFWQR